MALASAAAENAALNGLAGVSCVDASNCDAAGGSTVPPFDFVVFGTVAAYAKGAGFWAFLKGTFVPGGLA